MTDFSVPIPPYSSLKRSTKPIRARKKAQKTFKTLPDGREVCYARKEYRQRIKDAAERQRWICCLYNYCPICPGLMHWQNGDVTFEHEDGRGMGGGKRDDRIVLPDGTWINGAAHLACNQWKGSRNIPYNVPANSFARTQVKQPATE